MASAGVGRTSAALTEPTGSCFICLESDPPPIQSGCACRSDGGLAHVECLIAKAVAQQPHRGNEVWWECQTCKQDFTGMVRTRLGEVWMSRVCDRAEENLERLDAAHNLAECRRMDGQYAEAEQINREVVDVQRRVLGDEHPSTLTCASNLALALSDHGKHAEAEQIEREVLAVQRRVLGDEHPSTLIIASNLASSLSDQGSMLRRSTSGVRCSLLRGAYWETSTPRR
jgi:hypothetical protein